MLKLNSNYSDYTDETDVNYPEGKAVNASSSESYDGTPLLAEFMNDINAAHIAMYEKAYGNRTGISGIPDNQKVSQFADAVAKYTDDKVKAHTDQRGLANGVHGATSEATPGQIVSRDKYGCAKVSDPLEDNDIATKKYVDNLAAIGILVGEIRGFAGATAPKGWLLCQGQMIEKSKYPALYSVIGDRFGNGTESLFCLPDGRGKSLIGSDSSIALGASGGSTTISVANLPRHTHTIGGNTGEMSDNSYGEWGTRVSNDKSNGTGNNRYTPYSYGNISIDTTKQHVLAQRPSDDYTASNELYYSIDVSHKHSLPLYTGVSGGNESYRQPYFAGNYIIKY